MIEPRYQSDRVTLYCADCEDVMTDYGVFPDFIFADPPYLEGDKSRYLSVLLPFCYNLVVTPGNVQALDWIIASKPVYQYAWQSRSQSMGGRACMHISWEPILAYEYPKKPLGTDLLTFPIGQPDQKNGHPWAKPLYLIKFIVSRWSNESDLVLDPFMGSGTTGVACMQTGRRFIGIEIDEGYYAIAEKRIRQAESQLLLGI